MLSPVAGGDVGLVRPVAVGLHPVERRVEVLVSAVSPDPPRGLLPLGLAVGVDSADAVMSRRAAEQGEVASDTVADSGMDDGGDLRTVQQHPPTRPAWTPSVLLPM
jgi:hypothetical protein